MVEYWALAERNFSWIWMCVCACFMGITLGGIHRNTWKNTERKIFALRSGVALGIASDLFCLEFQWYCWISQVQGTDADRSFVWKAVYFLLIGLVSGFLFIKRVSLYPDEQNILLIADKSQQRKYTHCLIRIIYAALFFLVWSIFLIFSNQNGSLPMQFIFFCFSTLLMLMLLYFDWATIRFVCERLETLVDQQYKTELLNLMQVVRSQRHDFNFHMQAISGMIENEQYEECQDYIHTMVKRVEYLNNVLPLHNPATSAMINAFVEMAAAKEIRIEIEILTPLDDLPCSIYEINTIIGNLLQNAIDEVEKKSVNDKWIRLLIMKRNKRDIVRVSNPCVKKPEEFEEIFHPGYTTKVTHEGIGLVTVKKLTTKYGGTIYLEHEPEIVHFIARIPCKA